MSIGNYSYGMNTGLAGRDIEPDLERDDCNDDDKLIDFDRSSELNSSMAAQKDITNFNFFDPEFEMHLSNPQHPNHNKIVNFLMHLALCHTVVIQTQKKEKSKDKMIEHGADSDRSHSD